jgi:hypothetical protein
MMTPEPGDWADAEPSAQEAMEHGFHGYTKEAQEMLESRSNCHMCHAIVEDRYMTLHFKWHRTLKHKGNKK